MKSAYKATIIDIKHPLLSKLDFTLFFCELRRGSHVMSTIRRSVTRELNAKAVQHHQPTLNARKTHQCGKKDF